MVIIHRCRQEEIAGLESCRRGEQSLAFRKVDAPRTDKDLRRGILPNRQAIACAIRP